MASSHFVTALVGQLHDDADPVVLVAVAGDQALAGHAVDAVGHGGRGEAEALGEFAGAQPVGGAGEDEGLEDLPLGVADAEGGDLAAVRDVHPAVQPAECRDDLLDLGVEVVELALVGGDLLVEARLLGAVGLAGSGVSDMRASMPRDPLASEVLRVCIVKLLTLALKSSALSSSRSSPPAPCRVLGSSNFRTRGR